MRHITQEGLTRIQPLLARLRAIDGLVEKKTGVFYRKSRAFLHFHEHEEHVLADVRLDGLEFARLPATTDKQHDALVRKIERALKR